MAVVLTILKIIGIILLCIIGLILLIALLVLFVPIRYKADGAYTEEDTHANVNVRWLFFRVLANFKKDESLLIKVKVAFFTIRSQEKKVGKAAKEEEKAKAIAKKKEQASLPPPEPQENVPPDAKEEKPPETAEEKKTADLQAEDPAVKKKEEKKKEEKKKEKPDKKEIKEKKKKKEKASKEPKPEDEPEIPEFEEEPGEGFMEKLEKKRADLEKKRSDLEKKKNHIIQFLQRDFVKRTIQRGKKLIKKYMKHFKPKKGRVDVHMGLGSAASTGMVLGKISVFYALYGKWLFITPDFYNKVLEAAGNVKGRIRIGTLAIPALILYLRKDTRRTIKLAKKI